MKTAAQVRTEAIVARCECYGLRGDINENGDVEVRDSNSAGGEPLGTISGSAHGEFVTRLAGTSVVAILAAIAATRPGDLGDAKAEAAARSVNRRSGVQDRREAPVRAAWRCDVIETTLDERRVERRVHVRTVDGFTRDDALFEANRIIDHLVYNMPDDGVTRYYSAATWIASEDRRNAK